MSSDDDDKPNSKKKAGYKNPPKHTQFKSGQSGNPRGRPKKQHEPWKTPMDKALAKIIRMPSGQKISKEALLCDAVVNGAIKGVTGDRRLVMQHINKRYAHNFEVAIAAANTESSKGKPYAPGGVLVVPGIADMDAWEAAAVEHQEKLARDCAEDHAKTADANKEIEGTNMTKLNTDDDDNKQ